MLLKLGHFPPCIRNARLLECRERGRGRRACWAGVASVRPPNMPLSLKQIRAGAGSPGNGLGESSCRGASGRVIGQARTGLCSLPLHQATTGALQAAFYSISLPGPPPNSYPPPNQPLLPPWAWYSVPWTRRCLGSGGFWNAKANAVSSFQKQANGAL